MESDSDQDDCPLCLEEIDITDKYFKPCPCGYQICRFCWNHIKKDLNSLCPACRRQYCDDDVEFKAVSSEEIARIRAKKKRREREKKEIDTVNKKQLANVRVVQKNLVYVLGLPLKLATEEILKSQDYFGQYGKITKVVINKKPATTTHANSAASASAHTGVYITYQRKEDAQKAIEQVDGTNFEGKVIRATYGTTKYCSYFLKGQPCQNIGCQFLHENGEDAEAYLKEESRLYNQRVKEQPMKITFQSKPKDETETSLPPTASWAKPIAPAVPISLNSSKQFPALGTAPIPEPEAFEVSDAVEMPMNEDDVLGSAALEEDSVVPCMDFVDLKSAGYTVFPRYNGLFDPFGGDRLKNALLALVSGKEVEKQAVDAQPKADPRKSRFERLFDGHASMDQESLGVASADSPRWSEASGKSRPPFMQQDYREPFQQQDAQKMQQYQMMMQQQSKYPQDFQDSFHQSEFSIFH